MVIKTVRNKSFCRLSVTMLPAITKGLRATSVFTFTVDEKSHTDQLNLFPLVF